MNKIARMFIWLIILGVPVFFILGLLSGFLSGFFNGYTSVLPISNFSVSPEYFNGILSANGIIIGFWAVIISLSNKNKKFIWKGVNLVELTFFVSLGSLIFSVFLFAFQAFGATPSFYAIASVMYSFYLTCVLLGITLHFMVFVSN
jgi:hypothetical protein